MEQLAGELTAAADTRFVEDLPRMVLHRVLADVKCGRHLGR
ncbi:hypothetical protein [Streptomyces albipurpureus]|nr:hypothetical protein [Streptomyces sp. CWNU-1]